MKQNRSRYQQGSLKKFKGRSGRLVWVYRWRETDTDGKRRQRKKVMGTVEEFPTERQAWLAVEALRLDINRDLSPMAQAPKTVKELIRHYESTELAPDSDKVAYSTKGIYSCNLKNWIEPKWGAMLVSDLERLPGVYVENWLASLKLAPNTKAKLRNILSAVCSHAVRYGWMLNHPIKGKVRQSTTTILEQEALDIDELQSIHHQLGLMYQAMLVMSVPTGMRCGEVFALQWCDIDFPKRQFTVHKSVWHQHVGPVKTEASAGVLPLTEEMAEVLLAWRVTTKYASERDWVFASSRKKGRQPLWPDGVMGNHIAPAAKQAGVTKRVTWHTFRHTFSTLLIANGEDVKTVQSLMRHSNPNITLGLYTHSVDERKRSAQSRVVEMVLPGRKGELSGNARAR